MQLQLRVDCEMVFDVANKLIVLPRIFSFLFYTMKCHTRWMVKHTSEASTEICSKLLLVLICCYNSNQYLCYEIMVVSIFIPFFFGFSTLRSCKCTNILFAFLSFEHFRCFSHCVHTYCVWSHFHCVFFQRDRCIFSSRINNGKEALLASAFLLNTSSASMNLIFLISSPVPWELLNFANFQVTVLRENFVIERVLYKFSMKYIEFLTVNGNVTT